MDGEERGRRAGEGASVSERAREGRAAQVVRGVIGGMSDNEK